MERKNMPELKSKTKWDKENSVLCGVRLMTKTDSDIIDHLAKYPSKSGEIKRLLRIAIAAEKKEETDNISNCKGEQHGN